MPKLFLQRFLYAKIAIESIYLYYDDVCFEN